LLGEANENHKNLIQDSWCSIQDSNQALPKFKSRELSLPTASSVKFHTL
jgi:hypothetical protein